MRAATRGPNVTWGAHISNGGPGTTAPPAGDGPGSGQFIGHANTYNWCFLEIISCF